VVIIIVIVGIFAYQQISQREALRNIQVSLDGVKIDSINLTSATLNFTLRLTNPNTNPATLDRTVFTVYINNNNLGTGQTLQKTTIPAGGSELVQIPFTVSYSGAALSVWAALTQGSFDYKVVGTAYFDSLFGTVSVPYTFTGTK